MYQTLLTKTLWNRNVRFHKVENTVTGNQSWTDCRGAENARKTGKKVYMDTTESRGYAAHFNMNIAPPKLCIIEVDLFKLHLQNHTVPGKRWIPNRNFSPTDYGPLNRYSTYIKVQRSLNSFQRNQRFISNEPADPESSPFYLNKIVT